ncbi:hypothetical protein [Jeotgalibacillus salarius]|uniref:Uncharacterized protein n=1 Tax=Jeotgalibacillus salarius TaxID=546023 RepID=A0A4Y8LEG9_9BACL|nr:hypothetical protein [Jeotgalibacillus salarius]TFD99450.1 hypothetical protein E2626_14420 [Jeotgalibacillus salarius]
MLVPNGIELEIQFNHAGLSLTERLKQEIGETYKIKYITSSSARINEEKEVTYKKHIKMNVHLH